MIPGPCFGLTAGQINRRIQAAAAAAGIVGISAHSFRVGSGQRTHRTRGVDHRNHARRGLVDRPHGRPLLGRREGRTRGRGEVLVATAPVRATGSAVAVLRDTVRSSDASEAI